MRIYSYSLQSLSFAPYYPSGQRSQYTQCDAQEGIEQKHSAKASLYKCQSVIGKSREGGESSAEACRQQQANLCRKIESGGEGIE